MDKFTGCLKQGKIYEEKALEYFDYDTYETKEGYFKGYDFTYTKDLITKKVEVKSDRLAGITGNLCIEYNYKGKPSGIKSTTANYWVYYILYTENNDIRGKIIHEEAYKIPTKALRKIVSNCKRVKGGDRNMSMLYILPKEMVEEYLVSDPYIDPHISLEDELIRSMCGLDF